MVEHSRDDRPGWRREPERALTGPGGLRVTLRGARHGDAGRLCDFKRVILGETEYLLQGREDWVDDVDSERQLIEAFAQHPRSLLALAVEGDASTHPRVVGMCSVVGGPFARNAHVGQLGMGVLRSHWRHGIGQALLDYALHWAAGRGHLHKVTLQVHADNASARQLYQRAGFVEEGLLHDEARLGGAYADLVLMGRFLADLVDLS